MDDIAIYENGTVELNTSIKYETVWLNQKQMAELFGKAKSTINKHIGNIYQEGELEKALTIQKFGNSEFI